MVTKYVFLLSLLAFGCTTFQKADVTPELQTRLDAFNKGHIPLQDYFKEAEYSELKISPDGRFIAALFPRQGVNSIAILSADLSKMIFTGNFDDNRHIFEYEWVSNTRLMLTAGKKYGYLDGRRSDVQTYFVDYDGKNLKNFFAQMPAFYNLIRILPNDPDWVVMEKYHYADRGRPIAVKVNVHDGREKGLAYPPIARGSLLADSNGEVNVALENSRTDIDVSQIHYRLGKDQPWTKLQYPVKGKGHVKPLSLNVKEKTLYVLSPLETGRDAIYRVDLATGKSTVVSSDPVVDVSGPLYNYDKLIGADYEPDYPEIEVIDAQDAMMKFYKDMVITFKGQRVGSMSFTRDLSTAIFGVWSDRDPGSFYQADVKARKIKAIGRAKAWLKEDQLAAMKPIQFKARDGLVIHGYLTLPPKGPQKNLPAVLLVHGGPHGVRDYWEFNPQVQFLAERGFAVLQVNYRGSGGYGQKFLESGYRQWGLSMQDDVTDATNWLVKEGYAHPKRLAIYGGSYGGYAALMGVVREPQLYRCAVTNAGVSDLTIQTNNSDTTGSELGEDYLAKALGTDEADLKKRSALYNVDRIQVPIFIAAGMDDVRVPYKNATALKEAMDKAGKPYEWMAKPSEGHGFQQEANRYEFYMRLAEFLEKNTSL